MTARKQVESGQSGVASAKGRPVELTQDDIEALAGDGAKAEAVRKRLAAYDGKPGKVSRRAPAAAADGDGKGAPTQAPPGFEAA